MDKIKLLYVENVITRKTEVARQSLSFFMLADNLDYQKKIDVIWAGEDGVWHTLPAIHDSNLAQGQEYWSARAEFSLASDKSLPGNIRFALRYQVADKTYWDNNQGQNYSSEADSGIMLGHDIPLLNIGTDSLLQQDQKTVPITIAVDKSLAAEKVIIHWTPDDWKTTNKSPCHFKKNHWDTEFRSNARNPNQYGVQVWRGLLRFDHAFRVQYSISCESKDTLTWDNNLGENYSIRRGPLRILILNLHCYQEDNQDHKFSQIARAIDEMDVDIVCFQEVAELWNDGEGDWETNSARIINSRLKTPYHLVTDWAHLGFDQYREGVAILSRYPIARHESKYVSGSHDPYSIHSRKVIMAQVKVPHMGLINVFSSHLSWWDDGFAEQFETLRQWAADRHTGQVKATLLCGDFNIKAGSKGYELVVESNEYDDQYLAVNAPKVFVKIFRDKDAGWQRNLDKDHRIDYVFLHKSSELRVVSGDVLFTEQDYGSVSDHQGYLMAFEPK